MDILQMSISASLLIIAVAIIRAVAIYKLPKRVFVILWGIILFKLLVPLSIPLPFNMYEIANPAIRLIAGNTSTQAFLRDTISTIKPLFISISFGTVKIPLPSLVWATGAVVCALYFCVIHLHYRKEYGTSLPLENSFINGWLQSRKLRRQVLIRYSDRIDSPITYGVLKPVILFPKTTDWQNEEQLQYILAHELTHIKHFDVLLKGIFIAAACLHWFNPLVWLMYVLVNRDIELSCDESVIYTVKCKGKSAYAMTLIGLEENRIKMSPLHGGFTKNAINERVTAIMKITSPSSQKALQSFVLVMGAVAGVMLTSASGPDVLIDRSVPIFDSLALISNSAGDDSSEAEIMYIAGAAYHSFDNGKTWFAGTPGYENGGRTYTYEDLQRTSMMLQNQ